MIVSKSIGSLSKILKMRNIVMGEDWPLLEIAWSLSPNTKCQVRLAQISDTYVITNVLKRRLDLGC